MLEQCVPDSTIVSRNFSIFSYMFTYIIFLFLYNVLIVPYLPFQSAPLFTRCPVISAGALSDDLNYHAEPIETMIKTSSSVRSHIKPRSNCKQKRRLNIDETFTSCNVQGSRRRLMITSKENKLYIFSNRRLFTVQLSSLSRTMPEQTMGKFSF